MARAESAGPCRDRRAHSPGERSDRSLFQLPRRRAARGRRGLGHGFEGGHGAPHAGGKLLPLGAIGELDELPGRGLVLGRGAHAVGIGVEDASRFRMLRQGRHVPGEALDLAEGRNHSSALQQHRRGAVDEAVFVADSQDLGLGGDHLVHQAEIDEELDALARLAECRWSGSSADRRRRPARRRLAR